ncbi:ArsA family ATPase [Pseudonocardia benzenivorans]
MLLDGAWGALQGHLRTLLAGIGVDEIVADELTVLPGVEDLLALAEVRRLAESGRGRSSSSTAGRRPRPCACSPCPRRSPATWSDSSRAPAGGPRMLAGLTGRGAAESAARLDRTVDALDGLAEQLSGLAALLVDPARSSVRLVTTPERVVVAETRRTQTALALQGIRVDGLVVNRVLPAPSTSLRGPAARWLRERHTEQQAVLDELTASAAGDDVVLRTLGYAAAEPTGVAALHTLADALYGEDDPVPAPAAARPPLAVRRTAGRAPRSTPSSSWRCTSRAPTRAGSTWPGWVTTWWSPSGSRAAP